MLRVARLAAACGVVVPVLAMAQVLRIDPQDCAVATSPACQCGKAHMLMARQAAGGIVNEPGGASFSAREAPGDTDLQSIDLDIEITPSGAQVGFIIGSQTMRVRSKVNGLTQFTFMLRSNFTVNLNNSGMAANNNRVQLNGATTAVVTTPAGNSYARTVTLDRPYNANEEFTVKIWYSGTAVSRGFGSITFGTQGGTPIVSTLSEAYYAATWMPIKDGDVFLPGDNSDKCTGRIAITAPNTLETVGNGLLEGVDVVAGGKSRYRWTTNQPTAPYLFLFSTTNYNQWSQTYTYPLTGGGTGTMPVEFSIYPASDTAQNRAAWEKTLQMLPVLRSVYGEYPFVSEKYGIYQFPFGGGMEHQTYTGQGTFDEGVTVHELGHQWWGDNVTCKTWNHIWLNEGFATYTEALWAELKPGSAGLPALQLAMSSRRPPNNLADSVYCPTVSDMNRIFQYSTTYAKGAWVLHMLRGVIGDADFFDTLDAYRAAYQGSAAITDDFFGVAESVSGEELDQFMQQWVYGIGAPTYAFGRQDVTIAGQAYTRLHIRQTQPTTWGASSKFVMPIGVRLNPVSGAPVLATVQNTERLQHYLFPVSGPTASVLLDQFDWVLNNGVTEEAYALGPPKVVLASPAPGETLAAAPSSATITFSDNVTQSAGAFAVSGPSGAVPFTHSYNPATFAATLTFGAALAPGTYAVSVAAAVVTTAGGALDGEVIADALPSGNGIAGGNASFSFVVDPPACVADVDNGSGTGTPDGAVDISDLLYYLVLFDAGNAAADLDDGSGTGTPDGGVDISDLLYFLARFDAGC